MPPALPPISDAPCYLLELAAELRNRIYEYVLIKDKTITVSRHRIAQPGLLRTCRQIREEARAIYYCRNAFKILRGSFGVSIVRLFFKQATGFWGKHKKTECSLRNISYVKWIRPKWDKALLWLQAYHADEVARFICSCDGTKRRRGCCQFEKAFEILDCVIYLQWQSVKLVLDAYREAVRNETYREWA